VYIYIYIYLYIYELVNVLEYEFSTKFSVRNGLRVTFEKNVYMREQQLLWV